MTTAPKQTYVNINPTNQQVTDTQYTGEFAALINVKESRYSKIEYNPDFGISPKIGIKWVMGTTKGNTFEKNWSTGIPWENTEVRVSEDGKRLVPLVAGFKGYKPNSDGFYFLQKVISAGFPAERIVDDISIFDGETFFVTTDTNPRSKGSSKKSYPKQYHPEGWDEALAAQLTKRAAREAQDNKIAGYQPPTANQTTALSSNPPISAPATLQSTYAPPAVVQTGGILKAAGEALVAILAGNGGTAVKRTELPAKLNTYTGAKTWEPKFRQEVTLALWDMEQLKAVVGNNPALKIDGEVISFN